MHQQMAPKELRSELADTHGGTTALHGGALALPSHSKAWGGAHEVREMAVMLTCSETEKEG